MGCLSRMCRGTPGHAVAPKDAEKSRGHQSLLNAGGSSCSCTQAAMTASSCVSATPMFLTCEPAQSSCWRTNHSFQAPSGCLAGLKDVKGGAGGWQEV